MNKKAKCPYCDGTGIKQDFKKLEREKKERVVLFLHKEGYKWSDILKLTGYKSPRSISQIIKKNNNGSKRI
jgi:hypothetical protein